MQMKRPATGLAQVAANASTPAAMPHATRARLPLTAAARAAGSDRPTAAAPPRPDRPGAELPIKTRAGPHSPPCAATPNTPARARARRRAESGRPRSVVERSAQAHAATANATPSVNGIRPITTFAAIPLANSQVASRAAPSEGPSGARAASVRIHANAA